MSKEWWVEREFVDRNLVVVRVNDEIQLYQNGALTQDAFRLINEIKEKLFVEEFYAGVFDPNFPNELHFQYPTQKITKSGNYVRISIPARMLSTRRDFVTIKRNEDGTILIIP
jgi:hypothetical protein